MKVATFMLEMTVPLELLDAEDLLRNSIFRSCLTLTWHERRTVVLALAQRELCPPRSGRTSPPPSVTLHLHIAQVPPPPQADGMKTLLREP